MPWTTQGANDFLKLLLNAVALNVAYDGTLYVSAHTASPGAAGSQTTNEISYTGYARFALTRDSDDDGDGFDVTNNAGENELTVDWGAYSAGTGGTITHFGIGTEPSGTGRLIFWGTVSPSLVVTAAPHHPTVPAGDLDITMPTS